MSIFEVGKSKDVLDLRLVTVMSVHAEGTYSLFEIMLHGFVSLSARPAALCLIP